jgi:hypothetical protein
VHHGESELLDELVKSPPSIDADRVREAGGNIAALTSQQLREASRIIEAKATPSEVEDYKRFVWTVAQAVASAHEEGGFLGVGASRSATPRTRRWTKSRQRWATRRQPEATPPRAEPVSACPKRSDRPISEACAQHRQPNAFRVNEQPSRRRQGAVVTLAFSPAAREDRTCALRRQQASLDRRAACGLPSRTLRRRFASQ